MFATHDPRLVEIAGRARRTAREPDEFEFQMLYGIRPRRAAPAGRRRAHGAGLRALRRPVVRLPDAPAGRAPGQPGLLRPRAGLEGLSDGHGRTHRHPGRRQDRRGAAVRAAARRAHAPATSSSAEKHAERAAYLAEHLRRRVTVDGRGGRGRATAACSRSSRRTSTRCWPRSRRRSAADHLVVSVAAGITTAHIEAALADGRRRSCGACRTPRRWSTRR